MDCKCNDLANSWTIHHTTHMSAPLSALSARQRHPIAGVAQRTGLSQDVLRVWERRYEAVVPARSETGVRLYSDADIERLILLRTATRGGRGIGQVAKLSTRALETIVAMMRAFAHRPGAPTVRVTTSAGERHVIGAALVGAAAALEGWNVLYLGANLPAGEIAAAAKSTGVRVVAVSIIYVESASRVRDEMRALRDQLPEDVPLIAGGSGAMSMAKELAAMNIRVKSSVSGFLSELRRDTIAS